MSLKSKVFGHWAGNFVKKVFRSVQKRTLIYSSIRSHQGYGMASMSPGTPSGCCGFAAFLVDRTKSIYTGYFNPKTKTHFRAAINGYP